MKPRQKRNEEPGWRMAELEVTYKAVHSAPPLPLQNNSFNAYTTFMSIWDKNKITYKEQMYALYLNTQLKMVGWYMLSEGGINNTIVDLRIIFSIGLRLLANKLIIAHNHPSGNLYPSDDDLIVAQHIINLGEIHFITLSDFLIVSDDKYFSFVEHELMNPPRL